MCFVNEEDGKNSRGLHRHSMCFWLPSIKLFVGIIRRLEGPNGGLFLLFDKELPNNLFNEVELKENIRNADKSEIARYP